MTDERRPFDVTLKSDGPAWVEHVNAIGPHEARLLARQNAYDAGEPDVLVVKVTDLNDARLDAEDADERRWKDTYGPEYAGLAAYQAEGR